MQIEDAKTSGESSHRTRTDEDPRAVLRRRTLPDQI